MFVSVVIDLKTSKLDKLYDYIVPKQFEDQIQIGTRVLVPFGNQDRIGYVLDVLSESTMANKAILDVVDIEPLLNEELLMIYSYLETYTTSLKSAIIETIIPSEFLMDYEKEVIILDNNIDSEILKKATNNKFRIKTKDKALYKRLKELQKEGKIKIKTALKPRQKAKKLTSYKYNYTNEYKRIGNYPEVVEAFMEKEEILRKDLLKIVSASKINTLLKHDVLIKSEMEIERKIDHEYKDKEYNIKLNSDQKYALSKIKENISKDSEILLKGIPGSGKTEVYVRAAKYAIDNGKNALILVPEINLVAPLAQRLSSLFKDFAIIHSSLSSGEKYDQYEKIYNDKVNLVIGTRSAIFAPIDNLGLIVLDEEQDESYLQTDSVIYDTYNIAKIRAKYHDALVLLVSATPKLKTMHKANNNEIGLLQLSKPAVHLEKPELVFVDMKKELASGNTSIISKKLEDLINLKLQKNEQIMILVNRKGYSPIVLCRNCGDVPICPTCGVPLTYYKNENELKCHYCGHSEPFEEVCKNCHHDAVYGHQVAIEQAESVLKNKFKDAKIIRMDQNTTRRKNMHEKLWYKFYKKDADILLGTEMIAKGFDFPDVTLVSVLFLDQSLKSPRYNSDEEAYFMLYQLVGRAGRHKPGLALIQGYDLDNLVVDSLKNDYDYFYKEAIYSRKVSNYPPFKEMSEVIIEGPGVLKSYRLAYLIKQELNKLNLLALGPNEARIPRRGDNFRYKVTIKHDKDDLEQIISLLKQFKIDDFRVTYTPFVDIE